MTTTRPSIPDDLRDFLKTTHDAREIRRGLAVKMEIQRYEYADICEILDITPGFISSNKKKYLEHGSEGLRLQYKGGTSFLNAEQHAEVVAWIKQQECWSVAQLQDYLITQYNVTYASEQSYYDLFAAAEIVYKRAQPVNPKADPAAIAAKKKR